MISARILTLCIAWVLIASSDIFAQDLSKYREFQLGTSLTTVAHQARIRPEVRVLHQRPELIQELTWHLPPSASSVSPGESVRKIVFNFYNGELFRIVVSYGWDRTEGLTVDDMIEALAVTYGRALLPATDTVSSLTQVYSDSERIAARWDDREYFVNLFRPSYASTFGLVVASKRLDALAQVASVEAIRLDDQEAPRRALERKKKQEDEDHARQEQLRRANKATFRP